MAFVLFFTFSIVLGVLFIPFLRRTLITKPIFSVARTAVPKISSIERQAIEAGSSGFDAELFSGKPNWDDFRSIPSIHLTKEEQAFLDGPTKKFCASINDWDIRKIQHEVPDEVWNFAKKYGFLSLRVSKEVGGHGFSSQAQSIILGMVASRSLDVSIITEVPNSLGPDELIEQYGTEEQKKQYLKKIISGEEIPCFAITSAVGGSDIAAMQDIGVVVKQKFNGKETLGVSLSWSKRYITLAPKATLIVLAFRLKDPEKILGEEVDRGITLALIPASHNGVNIGRRHYPSGTAFPNGPISGSDVFIPIDWIIGGPNGIGEGWKMVMQCLVAGRSVSVPSMSVATTKLILFVSVAYAKIRHQFNRSIGSIEGVDEVLARIIEAAYISESARAVTAASVSAENHPLVIASLMKYRMTEYARSAVLDAMDLHGGKGVMDGPSNYLQSAYQMIPIAITAEGSNIITRSLIVMGQAALRSHPYFRKELESLQEGSVKAFDVLFIKHIAFSLKNLFLSFIHNVLFGLFADGGKTTPKITRRWYRQLSRVAITFAFFADFMIILHRGKLKKKQKISGRLADVLSELYLLSCALKRFEDDGLHSTDYPILEMSMKNGLYRCSQSLEEIIQNSPSFIVRLILRVSIFSWGISYKKAGDRLSSDVARVVQDDPEVLERLTRYTYIPETNNDPVGILHSLMRGNLNKEEINDLTVRALAVDDFES